MDKRRKAAEYAVAGADWANFAANDLTAAARTLSEIGCIVARDLQRDAKDFSLAPPAIDDAWVKITKAIENIGRARASFERYAEELRWSADV